MRFAMTLLSLVLISSPLLAAGDQWPSDREFWLDELPRGYQAPDVVVLNNGIGLTVGLGTAAVKTCILPGKIAKEDLGTLMKKHFYLGSNDFRKVSFTTSPAIPNIWVIDDECSAIPFRYKTDSVEIEFDRTLPNGNYTIIFQSALLKNPNYKN